MKLVLTGIQGSGKSTQGNLLSKQLGLPYLSTGHIFRQIAKEKTQLGRYIKTVMNTGLLIPDDKTIEIVNSYISRPEYRKGYILDGFPRTITQAEKFKNHVDKFIYLEIPDKEALWRISYRDGEDRNDETLNALRKRIESFHKFTKPVVSYYEKMSKLVTIDGTQSIEEVNEEILKSLGKQIVKNELESWKQKNKSIIAIVGLPGSGKSEAATFYKEKGLPIVSFGKIVRDLAKKEHGEAKEEYEKIIRESLREKHGLAALAILNEESVRNALKKNTTVVIDGMRSWEEYIYLKKKLEDVRFYILAIYADKDLRYKRIANRIQRSKNFGEERDINELLNLNMGASIAFADFLIKNNFSKEEFRDKLDEVYREVYFS